MTETRTAGQDPGVATGRRRWPWALLPVAAALLYGAVHGFLRHRPSLEGMVPPDAFVTWRWRDLAAYDAARTGPPPADGSVFAPPSLVLGASVNLPDLPGVATDRPLLEVWLDPTRRPDPRYFVLPVAESGAMLARYRDADLKERHARHLVVHGDWAASAWDLDAARHAGQGFGLLPAARGAAWSAAADWPRLVDYALQPTVAATEPYRSLLAALGATGEGAERVEGPEGPQVVVPAGRVAAVRSAWARVELHAFDDARSAIGALPPGATGPALRVELVPAQGTDLAQALEQVARAPASREPARLGGRTEDLEVEIRLSHPSARRVLVLALWGAGVPWPEAVAKNGFSALRLDRDGAVAVGARAAPGLFPGWTIGVAGPAEAQPDLAAFGLPSPPSEGVVPLAAGDAPVTAPYGGKSPGGEVARAAGEAAGLVVQAFGAGAQAAATVWAREARPAGADDGKPRAASGHVFLGEFWAKGLVLRRLLGRAVDAGGLFGLLGADHAWHGVVSTDGRRLVVEALRATP